MKRFRVALLVTSVGLVLFFAGLLTAGLTSKESLYQALGNLAEVVHLVESEYVDDMPALEGMLPDNIVNRGKQGYSLPVKHLLRSNNTGLLKGCSQLFRASR